MNATDKKTQAEITPAKGIRLLKEGNQRFQNNKQESHEFSQEIKATTQGQFPFATILSCIDSRVPAEIVFDQGIGDLFSIRIAGNVISDDVLGSMEFGAKLAGAHLIVVMGHTSCGAVTGACNDVQTGKLTGLLAKIKPAIEQTKDEKDAKTFVNKVSAKNVALAITEIRNRSEILKEMEENGTIRIIGAMYDITTGEVGFYE